MTQPASKPDPSDGDHGALGGALLGAVPTAIDPNLANDVGDIASTAIGWGKKAVQGLDPLAGVAAGIGAIAPGVLEIGKIADWVFKLALPSNFIRLCAWIAAFFLIPAGLVLCIREMRTK